MESLLGGVQKTVVFIDIVKYSLLNEQQKIAAVECLENSIRDFLLSIENSNEDPTIVEGGDAYALDFANPLLAFDLLRSIFIGKTLDIRIRCGIFTGIVKKRITINGKANIFGSGIDYAQRVCSCCEPDQVLVSSNTVGLLMGNSDFVRSHISESSNRFIVKNGKDINVHTYSFTDNGKSYGKEHFGLKNNISSGGFTIIVGDRREHPPQTIGDVFQIGPSIDDLCNIFKLTWPANTVLRGDKLLCWEADPKENSNLMENNLFLVGSPLVNFGSFLTNRRSIFKFKIDEVYFSEILECHKDFIGVCKNDLRFEDWLTTPEYFRISNTFPNNLRHLVMRDPLHSERDITKYDDFTFALISFAPHLYNRDKFSLMLAGIDLCATLAITNYLTKIDFSDHKYGGILRIKKRNVPEKRWFDSPHGTRFEDISWETGAYTDETILSKVDQEQENFIKRLMASDISVSKIVQIWS